MVEIHSPASLQSEGELRSKERPRGRDVSFEGRVVSKNKREETKEGFEERATASNGQLQFLNTAPRAGRKTCANARTKGFEEGLVFVRKV